VICDINDGTCWGENLQMFYQRFYSTVQSVLNTSFLSCAPIYGELSFFKKRIEAELSACPIVRYDRELEKKRCRYFHIYFSHGANGTGTALEAT
jgi:hypothetical protein